MRTETNLELGKRESGGRVWKMSRAGLNWPKGRRDRGQPTGKELQALGCKIQPTLQFFEDFIHCQLGWIVRACNLSERPPLKLFHSAQPLGRGDLIRPEGLLTWAECRSGDTKGVCSAKGDFVKFTRRSTAGQQGAGKDGLFSHKAQLPYRHHLLQDAAQPQGQCLSHKGEWTFDPGATSGKEPTLPMQETHVRSLGGEDPLEEGPATHSSILAWRIPIERGAWRATVHGVTKSQTQLNWLSRHSSCSRNVARALCFCKTVLQRAQLPLSFCHSLFSWAPSALSPPAEPLSQQQRQQRHPISFVLTSHGGTLGGSHSTLHTLCPLQASSCPGSSSLWEQSLYLVTLGHAMTTWSLIAKQDHRWCCSHSAPVVQPHQPADRSLRWDERARPPRLQDS